MCVVGRWSLLVATSQAAVSGHHAELMVGGGCAPTDHVPSAAACGADQAISHACLVANLDQQTG